MLNRSDTRPSWLSIEKTLAIDTETSGLNPYSPKTQPILVTAWEQKGGSVVLPGEFDLHTLRSKVANPDITKIFFNAKFDIAILAKIGWKVKGPVLDTSIMARMCLPGLQSYTLKHIARKEFNDPILPDIKLKDWLRRNPKARKHGFAKVPAHILHPYALKDAEITYRLLWHLTPLMDKWDLWPVLRREMRVLKVVHQMEKHGIQCDRKLLDELSEEADKELKILTSAIRAESGMPGLNPSSTKQLIDAVYTRRGIWPKEYTRSAEPSVSKTALLKLGDDGLSRLILLYRGLDKARGTYLVNTKAALDDTGTLRVSFNQGGTKTGRFSSSGYDVKGQLQNVPNSSKPGVLGRMREVYVARRWFRFALADYDQVEARLCAHFSNDTHELQAIKEGSDLHGVTCKRVFGVDESSSDWGELRYISKRIRFLLIYGGGPVKLVESVFADTDGRVILSVSEADKFLTQYKEAHPELMELTRRLEEEASRTGGVRNPYGRFVPVEAGRSYTAVNYLIQSTAADLIKTKMLVVADMLKGSKSRLLLTVHDELIFEIHKSDGVPFAWQLAEAMEEREKFRIPLSVSLAIGKSWGAKKALKKRAAPC